MIVDKAIEIHAVRPFTARGQMFMCLSVVMLNIGCITWSTGLLHRFPSFFSVKGVFFLAGVRWAMVFSRLAWRNMRQWRMNKLRWNGDITGLLDRGPFTIQRRFDDTGFSIGHGGKAFIVYSDKTGAFYAIEAYPKLGPHNGVFRLRGSFDQFVHGAVAVHSNGLTTVDVLPEPRRLIGSNVEITVKNFDSNYDD